MECEGCLLGLLPEAEADALEEAYFTGPEVWERVRGAGDDLLGDRRSAVSWLRSAAACVAPYGGCRRCGSS